MKCLLQLFFILFLWKLKAQYITYDTGYFSSLCLNCFCRNQQTFQATLNFNGVFANSPQIIITSSKYDMDPSTNEFQFNILSTTQTSCTFKLYCPYSHITYSYAFNWIAIDDQRIQVINKFNEDVTGQSNIIFTFPISNMNFVQGFITQTSFGFIGPFNHQLDIVSIDNEQVKVSYQADNSNLKLLGFQVILGTLEAFQYLSQNLQTFSLPTFISPLINIPSGYIPVLPIFGLGYQNINNMRINFYQTIVSSQLKYQISSWSDSVSATIKYQIIWINISNSKVLYPFQLLKMSFTQIFSQQRDSNLWKLQISDQIYVTPITQQIMIQKGTKSLEVIYTVYCDRTQITQVQGIVLTCVACTPQSKPFSQNCSFDIHLFKYHFIFYQADQIYQQINLKVTSTGFKLTQSVINREGEQDFTLINLQLLNV